MEPAHPHQINYAPASPWLVAAGQQTFLFSLTLKKSIHFVVTNRRLCERPAWDMVGNCKQVLRNDGKNSMLQTIFLLN
jgi:hypothetical protein